MTDEDRALLEEYAFEVDDGRWMFNESLSNRTLIRRSAEEALGIIQVCLFLGSPVTDTITSKAWINLVNKVRALEEKVNR